MFGVNNAICKLTLFVCSHKEGLYFYSGLMIFGLAKALGSLRIGVVKCEDKYSVQLRSEEHSESALQLIHALIS